MKEFHIRNVFIETVLSLLPQVRPLEVEAEMPKRNFFVGAASILMYQVKPLEAEAEQPHLKCYALQL